MDKSNQNEKTQQIVFDEEGFIIESDETIFSTESFRNDSLACHFPFIKSILGELKKMRPSDAPLYFRGVESVQQSLKGVYYDYYFSVKEENGQRLTVWLLVDETECYIDKRRMQQTRQDKILSDHKKKTS